MGKPYESPQSKAGPDGYRRRFTISPLALISFVLVVGVVVALLLPVLSVAHENRSYTLTVILQPKVDLGNAPPQFALCRTREEATALEQIDPDTECFFDRVKVVRKNTFQLFVSACATVSLLKEKVSEDKWFVVQYETVDGAIRRKAVEIIKGRRPRVMRVEIP